MPTIRTVGPDAKGRLARKSKGDEELVPYREAIANLEGDAMLEVERDGETMRAIKLRVSRASKQVGKGVRYGETQDGTLLVWLAETPRRRRRRRLEPDPANMAAQVT
jgi:hypothetical protein